MSETGDTPFPTNEAMRPIQQPELRFTMPAPVGTFTEIPMQEFYSQPAQYDSNEADSRPQYVETNDAVEQSWQRDFDHRCSAAHQARMVLERRGGVMQPSGSVTPPPVNDLIRVANWLLTGE